MPSTPQSRFIDLTHKLAEDANALPDLAVRSVLADIDWLRRQVVAEIASVDPFRASQLDSALADLVGRFVSRYQDGIAPFQVGAWNAGRDLTAEPLLQSGLMLHTPILSMRQFAVAQGYQALLITHAAESTIAQISSQLRLGSMAGRSLTDVLERIAPALDRPGPFGTLAVRAEAIVRTELGRIQSIAGQAAMEESVTYVKDLKKRWWHSGVPAPRAREGHVDAADRYAKGIDVVEAYNVRAEPGSPYEDMQFPRDPAASPANTIFCGCQSLPYMAEWEGEILTAQAEQKRFLVERKQNNVYGGGAA